MANIIMVWCIFVFGYMWRQDEIVQLDEIISDKEHAINEQNGVVLELIQSIRASKDEKLRQVPLDIFLRRCEEAAKECNHD